MAPLKCPYCDCLFFSQRDLDNHAKAFGVKHELAWKKFHSKVDDGDEEVTFKDVADKLMVGSWREGTYGGEIMSISDPAADFYKALCSESSGWVANGRYEYKLSGNGKWVLRRSRCSE